MAPPQQDDRKADYGGFENYRQETESRSARVEYRVRTFFDSWGRLCMAGLLVAGVAVAAVLGSRIPRELPQFDNQTGLPANALRAEIEASGSHGPVGTIPPMLTVQDGGSTLTLTSHDARSISCVRVARRASINVEQGALICPMFVRGTGGRCARLQPGQSMQYELRPQAPRGCTELPLEYRVGDPHAAETVWWSDSALDEWVQESLPP